MKTNSINNENKLTLDELEKVNGGYICPILDKKTGKYKYSLVRDSDAEEIGLFDTLEEAKEEAYTYRYVSAFFIDGEELEYWREFGHRYLYREKPPVYDGWW